MFAKLRPFMTKTTAMDTALPLVIDVMLLSGRPANNSQRAIALAMAKFVDFRRTTPTIKNRIMLSMPAGLGKSTVAGLLVGLLEKQFARITVVYSDPDLMAFERKMIDGLRDRM